MSLPDAASIWLERHAQSLLGSLGRLARQPLATLLTVTVIAIALALPAALHVVVKNLRAATAGLDETVQLSVYLATGTSEAQAKEAARQIASRIGVADAVLVSPDEGLAEFRTHSDMGDALEALPDNPLPWLVTVRPSRALEDADALATLAEELRELERVDLVEADLEWVRRLRAVQAAIERLVEVVALVLAIGVLAVVGNTIRLEINARRAEIEVTKLVGGSNGFVRRPFLYSGFWQGLGGGLVAIVLIAAGMAAVAPYAARLAEAYGSSFVVIGLGPAQSAAVVAAGALLGILGAWLAAAYHLRRIEPRA